MGIEARCVTSMKLKSRMHHALGLEGPWSGPKVYWGGGFGSGFSPSPNGSFGVLSPRFVFICVDARNVHFGRVGDDTRYEN